MPHYLYVIASKLDGPVKLGLSADPDRRVRQLQTGHAETLKVFHIEPVDEDRVRLFETMLHRDNIHYRLRGEWFNMSVKDATAYVQFTIIQYDLVPIKELRRIVSRK